MVKESVPLLKVRGQPVSDGSFVCVLTFFGFGASGRDCCALALLKNSQSSKIRAHRTDDAAAAGLRFCMVRPPAHVLRALSLKIRQIDRRQDFQTYLLRGCCLVLLSN